MARIKRKPAHEDPDDELEPEEEEEEEEEEGDEDDDDDTQDGDEEEEEEEDPAQKTKKPKLTALQRTQAELRMVKKENISLKKERDRLVKATPSKPKEDKSEEDEDGVTLAEMTQALNEAHVRIRDQQKLTAVQDFLAEINRDEYLRSAIYIVPHVRVTEDDVDGVEYDEELLKDAVEQASRTYIKLNPRPSNKERGDERGGGSASPGGNRSTRKKVSGSRSTEQLLAGFGLAPGGQRR